MRKKNNMKIMKQIRPAIVLLLSFTVITGLIYPVFITGLAQLFFPSQANGSLIIKDGKVIGSRLIGQEFDRPEYFWGRLSATADEPYNAAASGGSNNSVLNPALQQEAEQRITRLKAADPLNSQPIPVDLITASGSGLDPAISIAAARCQASRVAAARRLPLKDVYALIDQHTHSRIFGIFGEPFVHVLELNLALDGIQ